MGAARLHPDGLLTRMVCSTAGLLVQTKSSHGEGRPSMLMSATLVPARSRDPTAATPARTKKLSSQPAIRVVGAHAGEEICRSHHCHGCTAVAHAGP